MILPKLLGLTGLLWASPIAEVAAFIMAAILMVRETKRMGKERGMVEITR